MLLCLILSRYQELESPHQIQLPEQYLRVPQPPLIHIRECSLQQVINLNQMQINQTQFLPTTSSKAPMTPITRLRPRYRLTTSILACLSTSILPLMQYHRFLLSASTPHVPPFMSTRIAMQLSLQTFPSLTRMLRVLQYARLPASTITRPSL
jgi:hypothetical protein